MKADRVGVQVPQQVGLILVLRPPPNIYLTLGQLPEIQPASNTPPLLLVRPFSQQRISTSSLSDRVH